MRLLLTGATGFIGRYVADQLKAEGVDVVTVGRFALNSAGQHIQADLLRTTDHAKIVEVARATHLIHLAWYTEHGKYWSSLLNTDWIKATANLLDAFCRQGGKHVTVAGTCAEYDWSGGYCTEDLTPISPLTVYGIAKAAAHRISNEICAQYGVPLAWGRVFFPYGRGESAARLIPSLVAAFEGRRPPFGVSRDVYRDFLHVTDVANALVMLSRKQWRGSVNISSGEATKLRDLVCLVADIGHVCPDEVLDLPPSRLGEPKFLVGNNDRLCGLGWKRKVDLKQGLKDFNYLGDKND
jgi:nucleoside-diphosphate-sugar epimerase